MSIILRRTCSGSSSITSRPIPPARSTRPFRRRKPGGCCAGWSSTMSPNTPAGSTWSRSRSACCAVSASTGASASARGSSPKSPPGRNNAMPPARASNGCSPPNAPAPNSPVLTPTPPKSHNPCAELLVELLQKSGESDFLRAVAEAVLQILMEADVEGLIGAGRHENSGDRLNYRNGYRDRSLDTRLGPLSLRIPKLCQGSYFPPFLEPRKTAEKALVMVIQEAWIGGVSTRRVDELVQAMGLAGISKSQVFKLCKDIDERVNAFLDRPIEGEWPYLWLDATYLKVRDGGRIVSVAAIIAVAVTTEGRREIVGLGIGPSEAEPF